ncbi:preprotein translocase subunit SecY [Candidatus Lokiarchaeum ossiferum]|uniref:preprotein translocase subunit SecY n=1 Tax=Candidatus Lokiarchaeum ossiferum TaxID=2951803 RepID=UPI00352C24CB
MAGKFLNLFSPFVRITPEIKQPDREISFKDKLIYTLVVLVLYIIMSNTPLYGLPNTEQGVDYYFWLRTILASQRGTLTEMGIGPIVTAGLIMQLLQGSKMINVNMADPSDRALFTGAQKVIAVFLTIFQIVAYLAGGAFGNIGTAEGELSIPLAIAIFLQLMSAGILIMMMDEILQKGYGLGSGVSLFIASGVAGQIFWNALSPTGMSGDGSDGLMRGIILAFFQVLFTDKEIPGPGPNTTDPENPLLGHRLFGTRDDNLFRIRDLWIREAGAPGLLGLILTIVIFGIVIYVETMRVEIPLTYAGYKGYRGKYPMKLLYVSNIPVILAQALYANFLFFGQLIWKKAEGSSWETFGKLIGSFEQASAQSGGASHMTPTGGLIYFLTPPQGLSALITKIRDYGDNETTEQLWEIIAHPIIYLFLFITICVFFGKIWVEVSGLAPRDIAGQIINSKMQIPGFRRSEKVIEKILKRYIPTLTILCGFIVGILSFTADFLGCLSSGTGLLLSVGIVQNYAETISKEAASEQYPGMRGLLGN